MGKVYLETTTVSASKSIAEIQEILIRSRATNINQTVADGCVTGLMFTLQTSDGELLFDLPARSQPVYNYLRKQRSVRTYAKTGAMEADAAAAYRIVWRQLLYWIRAQFALIQIGMVETQEVFFPYLVTKTGKRLFESFNSGGLKQITGAK